ncbi:hypothetical protein K438DRAFT_2093151 [Mycena galopus ATCC 62051]|nr:hypothetical protein K438DRAFT_2093151 [Mycena galopus ATCC 62051]
MALTGACHILVSSGNSFVFVKVNTDGGSLTLGVDERDLDTSDKADKEAVQWEIIASAGGYLIKNKMRSSYAIWKYTAKASDKVGLAKSSATALWEISPVDNLKSLHRIVPAMEDMAQGQLRWGVDDFKPGTPIVLSGKNYAFRIKPIRMAQFLEGSITDRAGRSSSDIEGRQAVTTSIKVVPKPPGVTKEDASLLVRKAYNSRVQGRYKDALSAQEKAVRCYRELLETNHIFMEDLAMSLLKLGFDFIKAPCHEDAVLTHKESIGLFKNLAKPDASLQARALQSLAASFRAAGFHEDASRAHEEGAAMFHGLAQTDPAHIADTLHCLAADFRIFGFREDAARTEEEAIKLYCELAATTTGANSLIECLELLAKGEGSAPGHASGGA